MILKKTEARCNSSYMFYINLFYNFWYIVITYIKELDTVTFTIMKW